MKYLDTYFEEQDERSDRCEFMGHQSRRERRWLHRSSSPAFFPYYAVQKAKGGQRKAARASHCKKSDVTLPPIPRPKS